MLKRLRFPRDFVKTPMCLIPAQLGFNETSGALTITIYYRFTPQYRDYKINYGVHGRYYYSNAGVE